MTTGHALIAIALVASTLMTSSGVYAARGLGKGAGNGRVAANRGTTQRFGPTVSLAPFRANQETGVVVALAATGWTISIPQALPLTVTVPSTATVTEAGTVVPATNVQPGYWVTIAGSYDRIAQSFVARRVTVLLPLIEGVVQSVNGTLLTVLTNRGSTVVVNTTQSTKWLSTAAMRRLQRRASGRQDTTPISSTDALSGTVTPAPPVSPSTGAVAGDRILVEGTLDASGASITALRVLLGVPAGEQAATFPGDTATPPQQ